MNYTLRVSLSLANHKLPSSQLKGLGPFTIRHAHALDGRSLNCVNADKVSQYENHLRCRVWPCTQASSYEPTRSFARSTLHIKCQNFCMSTIHATDKVCMCEPKHAVQLMCTTSHWQASSQGKSPDVPSLFLAVTSKALHINRHLCRGHWFATLSSACTRAQ